MHQLCSNNDLPETNTITKVLNSVERILSFFFKFQPEETIVVTLNLQIELTNKTLIHFVSPFFHIYYSSFIVNVLY
jgi:hypothetical protein